MMRPGSALSKAKAKPSANYGLNIPLKQAEHKIPQLQDYVKRQDWVGAIAFLENEKSFNSKPETNYWLAYAYFHIGDYRKALLIYDEMSKKPDYSKDIHAYKACCLYALCHFDEAKRECLKSPESNLQNRLMFHLAHKKNDEKNLSHYQHRMTDSTEDQLSLAAVHYLRGQYEEATEIYKKLLLENREYLAINLYVALCYYKLDYNDVSMEILQSYLAQFPNSITAINLKACNQYQLYNGKMAEQEFKSLQKNYEGENVFNDHDLLRHNQVIFRNGENALQVLPPLLEVFPEAKLNLVIYYIKNEDFMEAFNLIKDLVPSVPREYILKAIVYTVIGQHTENIDYLKNAQQLFQIVGSSPVECDTIPGRQCMASCFFLLKQFDDVIIYLKSIKNFFENDEDFNWNYGITCASVGEFSEAEEAFMKIQNEKLKTDECFVRWMARILIMNGKPGGAWELYINMETTNESINLLQIIANDCYRVGQFYYACKAFDILERFDSEGEYEDALKGSVVGVFQMVIAGKESKEHLIEVLKIMKDTLENNPQIEYLLRVIMKWGSSNGMKI